MWSKRTKHTLHRYTTMLKRFFVSLLGTMAGLWISLLILIFGGMMMIGVALGSQAGDNMAKIERKSILHFDLSGDVAERNMPGSFIDFLRQEESSAPTMQDMLQSLKAAATDDRIEGLYLECGGAYMGPASHQELVEAIEKFKKSGKWVYAYADSYSQGDYLIASTADYVDLNPVGAVAIHGLSSVVPFYTGLLDKLGVKMQIIKVGTYKSAVEPFVLKSMSEPARRQTQQFCDTIWNYMSQTIAANRGLSDSTVRALASEMIFTRPADTFVNDGLVDTLIYKRCAEETLRELSGIDEDSDLRLVSPADYLASKDVLKYINDSNRHIAVLFALGEISDSGDEGIVGDKMVDDIIDLADDDNVAGLVFRVNSPGGSAFASEQIWEALEYFKSQGKPLYVSMGDYAASGGYYISCGADSIFADRTTITGSIGVFGMIPDFSGLVTDKLGVNFSTVQTNPNASGVSVMEPMTPAQHAAMQQSVETVYELFTKRVAEGRKLDIDYVKSIAEGRVWVGSDALRLGLVDTLGSLENTVAAMCDHLGMTSGDVVTYPLVEEKLWEKILRQNQSLKDLKAAGYDLESIRYIETVKRLRNAAPIQARMPEMIIK